LDCHVLSVHITSFLFTFTAARITVFLIFFASRHLFAPVGRHVHHLNYGIFLLSGVGAYLLLGRPAEKGFGCATALYGIGLALTFDEFGDVASPRRQLLAARKPLALVVFGVMLAESFRYAHRTLPR
jgi:hypothetical protein